MLRNKGLRILAAVLLAAMLLSILPAYAQTENAVQGSLVIIGGALDTSNADVYNRFIELGGGKDTIKIAIIPAASETPVSSAEAYMADFMHYGVPKENIKVFPIAIKDDSSTEYLDESLWSKNGFSAVTAKEMAKYNAVFFVGGDQLLIVQCLVDDKGHDGTVLSEIRKIYKNGGVIGGTSAGAAIMTDPMIGSGTSLGALTQGVTYTDNWNIEGDNRVFITKGLGFLSDSISDQHFLKRGRLGRLIVAMFDQDIDMGYGIDENTALVVKGNEYEAVGASGVVVVDISQAAKDEKSDRFRASNIKIHYLEKGDKYNAATKAITINSAKPTTSGIEYYTKNSLNTNIFGSDSIKQVITADLVDNQAKEAVGISFDMAKDSNKSAGTQFIFRKGEGTEGFWGKINGTGSYSAVNVYLDIVSIEVNIMTDKVYEPK